MSTTAPWEGTLADDLEADAVMVQLPQGNNRRPQIGQELLEILERNVKDDGLVVGQFDEQVQFLCIGLAHEVEAFFLGQLADLGQNGLGEQVSHLVALGLKCLLRLQTLLAMLDERDDLVEIADQGRGPGVSLLDDQPVKFIEKDPERGAAAVIIIGLIVGDRERVHEERLFLVADIAAVLFQVVKPLELGRDVRGQLVALGRVYNDRGRPGKVLAEQFLDCAALQTHQRFSDSAVFTGQTDHSENRMSLD